MCVENQKHKFNYQMENLLLKFLVGNLATRHNICNGRDHYTGNVTYFIMFVGDQWLSSFSLPSNVGEIDSQFMEKNQKLFSSLERLGKNK